MKHNAKEQNQGNKQNFLQMIWKNTGPLKPMLDLLDENKTVHG
jgi:hypothetical protein